MVFQNVSYPKQKPCLNQNRKRPVTTFRMDPDVQQILKGRVAHREKSSFINKAIKTRYYLEVNKKAILVQLIRDNPVLAYHVFRQMGHIVDYHHKVQ